jgi:multicomponent Na+:H+ antiporter subunit E
MRTISLGCVLFVFWLLLSGHYTALLISLGILSCAMIALLATRMDAIDEEGHPIQLVLSALTYWPWLVVEIAKSSWNVTTLILNPALPISPTMIKVRARQKTRVGVTTFANSITLTPGTISIDVQDNQILVHAITAGGAEEVDQGTMNDRVCRFEGSGNV